MPNSAAESIPENIQLTGELINLFSLAVIIEPELDQKPFSAFDFSSLRDAQPPDNPTITLRGAGALPYPYRPEIFTDHIYRSPGLHQIGSLHHAQGIIKLYGPGFHLTADDIDDRLYGDTIAQTVHYATRESSDPKVAHKYFIISRSALVALIQLGTAPSVFDRFLIPVATGVKPRHLAGFIPANLLPISLELD